MIVIPLMNVLVYDPLAKRGTPLKPLMRMTLGMFIGEPFVAAVAMIQQKLDAGAHLSVMWQAIPTPIHPHGLRGARRSPASSSPTPRRPTG